LLSSPHSAERKKGLVCSTLTYDRVFKEIKALPKTVKHIVFQLGIPIAYREYSDSNSTSSEWRELLT